jgi:hypothetical protein
MALVLKQKHVTSYCKQKEICFPIKMCQLSEKVLLVLHDKTVLIEGILVGLGLALIADGNNTVALGLAAKY